MKEKTISKIREFNRFYLSAMDFYGNGYVGSEYSITESRVLYEIYINEECSADDIVKQLRIDKGYLSRIIKRFENNGILQRRKSEADARFYKICLTKEGKGIAKELIRKADYEIEKIIHSLSEEECIQLEQAMDVMKRILIERD